MRALILHARVKRLNRTGFQSHLFLHRVRFVSTCRDETFDLPIGNNGSVSIRVTRPAKNLNNESPTSKVILYLPSGPVFQGSEVSEQTGKSDPDSEYRLRSRSRGELGALGPVGASLQSNLASMTSATVVTVNFRLGETENASSSIGSAEPAPKSEPEPELVSNSESHSTNFHKYPTPIHDTLAGFDWIRKNLQPSKLAVFGSHIGGSLALMLALTEPQSVHAVAAYEPICDWPGLDDHCAHERITDSESSSKQKRPRRRKSAAPDLVPLLEARDRLFTSFERCFDAFASPILFLRAAGRDIPKTFPQYLTGLNYPIPVLKNTTKAITTEGSDSPDGSSRDRNAYSDLVADEDIDLPVRRRKALSRWPPHGLDYGLNNEPRVGPDHGIDRLEITLPWVRVFLNGPVGSTEIAASSKTSAVKSTVLEQQGEEMVSVMRKACFWGHEKGLGERVVTLSRVDDFSGQELASYFEDVFDKESSDDQ